MNNIVPSNNNAPSKSEFQAQVARITAALEQHDKVYPQLIAAVAPFDKELARLIAEAAAADAKMLQHLKTKAEAGESKGFLATVVGLLLGR